MVCLPNSHLGHLNLILGAFEIFKNLVYFLLKPEGALWLFVSLFLLQGAWETVKDLAAKALCTLHMLMNLDDTLDMCHKDSLSKYSQDSFVPHIRKGHVCAHGFYLPQSAHLECVIPSFKSLPNFFLHCCDY